MFVGKDLDNAMGFQLTIGPAGEVYREAGKLAEQRHDEIANAMGGCTRPISAAGGRHDGFQLL